MPAPRDGLFAYGSLAFDEVLVALLGRVPDRQPWSLTGWRAASLRDRPYPGLVADAAGVASGVVLTGLTAAEWRTLDEYEGTSYELRPVGPLDGGTVLTYVWLEDALVEPAAWDLGAFEEHLARYVALIEPRGGP